MVIIYNMYDPDNANLLEYKLKGMTNSMLWDYNGELLTAEVTNAPYNEIAATSFETNSGTGSWSGINPTNIVDDINSVTGERHYNESGFAIYKSSLLSSTTYIVSYWTKNSLPFSVPGTQAGYPKKSRTISINGELWTCFEHLVSGLTMVAIMGSGTIDDLRLYPMHAQMITYTYMPLVGITSLCDINNKVTYYKYDNSGRLKLIRDQEGNIIKKYDYKYQQ